MTVLDNNKKAVDFLINNKVIDHICQAYVYEFLNGDGLGDNPSAEQVKEWADTLNGLLDAYKDDPDFDFLKKGTTTTTDDQGNEVETTEYKRVKDDVESYKTFRQNQFSVHTRPTKGTAKLLYRTVTNLFKDNEGIATLYSILNEPEAVLLDERLKPRPGVTNLNLLANPEPVMNEELGRNLEWSATIAGARFYLFLLYFYSTGWYTKDYVTNLPVAFGATSLPASRAQIEGAGGAGGRADQRLAAQPIYFPYMAPTKPVYEEFTREIRGEPAYGIPPRTETTEKLTEKAELIGIVPNSVSELLNGETAQSIGNNPNQGTNIEIKTREQIKNLEVTDVFGNRKKYGFYGLTGGLLDEGTIKIPFMKESAFAGNILFFNGGTLDRKTSTDFFQNIHSFNRDVIISIGTLYPETTWRHFKDVLKSFIEEVVINESINDKILDGNAKKSLGKVKKRKKVKQPTKDALKPSDHQCYLLENIRVLSSYKDNLTISGDDKYKNIGTIYNSEEGSKSLPGNLISYIQHAGKNDEVNALLNLCPEIYALLTPHIKIYRVEYDGSNKLIPNVQQEIPFPNFIDPSDIQAIMNSDYGRFPGAGIKSFSWSLDGVNPGEIDNNISAKLSLHFQTIQDLFSLNQGLAAGQEKPGYLDLIIKSARSRKQGSGNSPRLNEERSALPISTECFEATMMDYDPRDFEIKACVGWSTPANFSSIVNGLQTSRDRGESYGKDLEAAINNTRLALYLTLTTHELNFNENGSVDLNINYQARLSGLARSPAANIFSGASSLARQLKDINDQLDKNKNLMKEKLEAYDAENREQALSDEAVESLSRQREELLTEKIKITKQSKAIKYKRFLNKLYNTNKIYNYVVPASDRKLLKNLTPEERAKKARKRASANEYLNEWNSQSSTGASAKMYEEAARQIEEVSKAADKPESADGRSGTEKAKELVLTNIKKASQSKPADLNIPFFYLGDLIDAVLEYVDVIIDKEEDRGSFQLILSQVELLDPLLAYQVKSVKIECPDNKDVQILREISEIDPMRFRGLTGLKFTTNIASIPVSLEVFQEWFINNIVKPQVDNYNVLRFVKTVCSSLIGKAFNSSCFEDLDFNLRFDTSIFNFDKTFTGKVTSIEELAASKKSATKKDCSALGENQQPTIPTFILYSVDSRPMTGNYDEDLNTGIYHYYLGAACGLAKKISFNRNDLPYYRESRLQRKSNMSALQLREMYSANIQMVGNNLHKNGQYIYVNPIAIGAGSMQQKGSLPNLARLLGIGGYYMVYKVSNDISSAGFNVTIDAIQEGIDFSGTGNTVTQLVPYEGKEILNPKAQGN